MVSIDVHSGTIASDILVIRPKLWAAVAKRCRGTVANFYYFRAMTSRLCMTEDG